MRQRPTKWTRIRDAVFPPKPPNWTLSPGLFLLSSLVSHGSIFLLPYAADTPSFNRVLGITRACAYAPLLLQRAAPVSWGAVYPDHHKAQAALTDLFRLMSFMSAILHGLATSTGLRYNLPDSHYHRHSRLLPWAIEKRSNWERTTTGVGKILGSALDHPVVEAVGYDVLLSGASTGLWAAVRSLSAGDILTSVVPLYNDPRVPSSELADQSSRSTRSASARRSGRSRKTSGVKSTTSKYSEKNLETPTIRRRGRPRKVKQEPVEEPGDGTYVPSSGDRASAEGDTMPVQELDLEAAALAWGLMAVGGLGLGSAGVFGGECLAR